MVYGPNSVQTTGWAPADPRDSEGAAERRIRVSPVMVTDGMTDTARLETLSCLAEDGTSMLHAAEVLTADEAARTVRCGRLGRDSGGRPNRVRHERVAKLLPRPVDPRRRRSRRPTRRPRSSSRGRGKRVNHWSRRVR